MWWQVVVVAAVVAAAAAAVVPTVVVELSVFGTSFMNHPVFWKHNCRTFRDELFINILGANISIVNHKIFWQLVWNSATLIWHTAQKPTGVDWHVIILNINLGFLWSTYCVQQGFIKFASHIFIFVDLFLNVWKRPPRPSLLDFLFSFAENILR